MAYSAAETLDRDALRARAAAFSAGDRAAADCPDRAGLLVRAVGAPPATTPTDLSGVCAQTGVPLTAGVPALSTFSSATGRILELFPGGLGGLASPEIAALYAFSRPGTPLHRSLACVGNEPASHPLISRRSAAEQSRPCWSDFVRGLWPSHTGATCLLIVSDDFKKRLWPEAQVGVLGSATPVLLHAGRRWERLALDWPTLLDTLDLYERALAAGFHRPSIEGVLWSEPDTCAAIGWPAARDLERGLRAHRPTPAWRLCTAIAQRPLVPPAPTPTAAAEPPPLTPRRRLVQERLW